MPNHKPSPFRGRWLWATIGVALLCALFLTLGIWQLQRLGQKRTANALILARMQEPPLTLSDQTLDPEQANLRRAVVRGTYDYSQEIVLRNRTLNEIPGVHVLVPLRIAGSDAAVLVDRGWIPYEMADPAQRAQFRDAAGEVEVSGILRRSQARPGRVAPADLPLGPDRPRLDAWHRVDIPRIQEQIPYPLAPLYLEEAQAARCRGCARPALPPRRAGDRAERGRAPGLCRPMVRLRRHPAGRLRDVLSPTCTRHIDRTNKSHDLTSRSGAIRVNAVTDSSAYFGRDLTKTDARSD